MDKNFEKDCIIEEHKPTIEFCSKFNLEERALDSGGCVSS